MPLEKRARFVLLLTGLSASAADAGRAPSRSIVFTHSTVIDATSRPPRSDMAVVITDGRIVAIDRTGRVKVPRGAEVVPADGAFLIPGLWNMHVHAGSYDDAKSALPSLVANGITGLRDMGAPLEDVLRLRKETTDGTLLGPRMVVAGPLLQGPLPFKMPLLLSVSNQPEARQAVAMLKGRGVDFVKIQDTLPRELYRAIAEEAKRRHLPFAGHIPPSVRAIETADAGQASIEHLGGQFLGVLLGCSRREAALHQEQMANLEGIRQVLAQGRSPAKLHLRAAFVRAVLESYDDDTAARLLARFAQRQIWQCPTLVTLKTLWPDNKDGLREEDLEYGEKVYAKDLEVVRAMHRAGVRFLAGTDGPLANAARVHDELAALVEAGLTPLEALQTATRGPATFLGSLDSFGTIEEGKVADLVLLEANPLEDIRNTRKVIAVVIRGRFLPKVSLHEMLAR